MSRIRKIVIILLLAVFVVSGGMLISTLMDYGKAGVIYSESRQAFHQGVPTPSPSEQPEEETYEFPDVAVDFDKLCGENPDVVGWIWIPDTEISYPLLQGESNNTYLKTSYDRQHTSSGSIFMDFRNAKDFSDDSSIIFGHNMKNGTMFGSLKNYETQDFFDGHREIFIFTPEADYRYEIFSAYKTQNGSKSYVLEFKDDLKATEYLELIQENSLVKSDFVPEQGQKLLMLSTCTSTMWNQRFVIHGVLTNVNEKG